MSKYTVRAVYDQLNAVRVHTPGIEILSGSFDPNSNHFLDNIPPHQARVEHEQMVRALEDEGVEVHQLAMDLETAGALDDLVRETLAPSPGTSVLESADLTHVLAKLAPHEKLSLILGRSRFEDANERAQTKTGTGTLLFENPLTNTYFQCDTTIIGDRGPILCNMRNPARRPEVRIIKTSLEGIGAEITYEVEDEPIEAGDFIPAGEFALLGTSAEIDGKETVIRTSYAAGRELLSANAIDYNEVGLVRPPLALDEKLADEHGTKQRTMHLLGWFNIAADGFAVAFKELAENADVEVYRQVGNDYRKDRTLPFLEYLYEKGYDVIDAQWSERWPANFLTIADGTVLPMYDPDEHGEYQPENNPTIERLKERGVEVVPNGTGIAPEALMRGFGGVRCMTMDLSRGQ